MLPVKPYTIAVPANGSMQMQVAGRYLRVNACTNPISVSIDGIGTLGAIGAGQGLKLPASVQPFQRLMFTDASGAVNNVTFIVADADFVDNTVLGTVSVVDGGKARTLAGVTFSGYATCSQGAAGTYPQVQIWNPAGSGKRAIIEQIMAASSIGGTFSTIVSTQTALTTLVGVAASKNVGNAGSTTQIRTLASATPDGGAAQFATMGGAQYQSAPYKLAEPIVLHPGWGLNVGGLVNQNVAATFEFYEELDA